MTIIIGPSCAGHHDDPRTTLVLGRGVDRRACVEREPEPVVYDRVVWGWIVSVGMMGVGASMLGPISGCNGDDTPGLVR